jgi:hypothetical protein
MCVNCVVSVTTFALPIIVGGAGVLHAKARKLREGSAYDACVDHGGAAPCREAGGEQSGDSPDPSRRAGSD